MQGEGEVDNCIRGTFQGGGVKGRKVKGKLEGER